MFDQTLNTEGLETGFRWHVQLWFSDQTLVVDLRLCFAM